VETLAHDLRHAVLSLARMRGAGILATLTLAIGIGGATTMFSVVYAALLRPPPFVDPDRLVILFNTRFTQKRLQRLRWSYPTAVDLRNTATSFEAMATVTSTSISVSEHGDPEQIEGEVVMPEYFGIMRVTPILGRTFLPGENAENAPGSDRTVAILSESTWRQRYAADPGFLGTTIRINDVPLTIVGVLPAPFAGLSGKASVWIPPSMAARLTYSEYMATPQHFITAVARLHPPPVVLAQAKGGLRHRRPFGRQRPPGRRGARR
jgi:hypothetical protein